MERELFSVGKKDVIKGFIVAILTGALTTLLQILQTGTIPDASAWKTVLISAVVAAISYILKNFLTNSQDEFIKPEPKNEEKPS